MKEIKHEVITQGTPKIENMPKEVFNVFCKNILDIVIKDKKDKQNNKSREIDSITDVSSNKKQKIKAPDFSDAYI